MYFEDYFENANFLPKEIFTDGTRLDGEFANIETYRECVRWLSEKLAV